MLTKISKENLEYKQFQFGKMLIETFNSNTEAVDYIISTEAKPFLKNFKLYVQDISKRQDCIINVPLEKNVTIEDLIKEDPKVLQYKTVLNGKIDSFNKLKSAINAETKKTYNKDDPILKRRQEELKSEQAKLEELKQQYEAYKVKVRKDLEKAPQTRPVVVTDQANMIYYDLLKEKYGVLKLEETIVKLQYEVERLEKHIVDQNKKIESVNRKEVRQSAEWETEMRIVMNNLIQIVDSAIVGVKFKQNVIAPDDVAAIQETIFKTHSAWLFKVDKLKKYKINYLDLKQSFDSEIKKEKDKNQEMQLECESLKNVSYNFAEYKSQSQKEILSLNRKLDTVKEKMEKLTQDYEKACEEIREKKSVINEIARIKLEFSMFLSDFKKFFVNLGDVFSMDEIKEMYEKDLIDIPKCSKLINCMIELEKNLKYLNEQKGQLRFEMNEEKNRIIAKVRESFEDEKHKIRNFIESFIDYFENNTQMNLVCDPLLKPLYIRLSGILNKKMDQIWAIHRKLSYNIQEKNIKIETMQAQVANTNEVIASLKKELSEKDNYIKSILETFNKPKSLNVKELASPLLKYQGTATTTEVQAEMEETTRENCLAEETLYKMAKEGVIILDNAVRNKTVELKRNHLFFKFDFDKWRKPFSELFKFDLALIWYIDEKKLSLENSKHMFAIITYITLKLGGRVSIWYGNYLNRKFNSRDYKDTLPRQFLDRAQDTFFCWFNDQASKSFKDLTRKKTNTLYSILLRLIGNTSVPRFLC